MLRYMREHTKLIMTIVIALFVLSCFGGYGLYSRSSSNRSGSNEQGMRDYPVAEVDGKNVMRSEIENGAVRLAEEYGNKQQIQSADLPHLRKAVLDGVAIQAEIEKEIENRKIDVTNDEIDAEYVKIMDSYPTREEFKAHIESSGIKESDIKADLKKQLSQQKLIASIESEITVTDAETRGFYNNAKDFLYKIPAGFKVNIATFRNNEAAKLAQKAIAGGANWDKIMQEHKADIETSTPYDKPILVSDQMMTGSFAKIKNYPMNKITPVFPITSNDSYIAVKRSKEAAKVLSFNEVSADVVTAIKGQKTQIKQNEFFDQLLKRAQIKILDQTIFPSAASDDVKSGDKQQ